MPIHSSLVITANPSDHTASFRLLDGHGVQRAFRHTDFRTIPIARQQGLFDLRNYLKWYVEPKDEAIKVAEIGVCIAEEVLGEEIFRALWEPAAHRVVTIQLPGAAEEQNPLAAALARVPWEIARPSVKEQTLADRNLLIRFVRGPAEEDTQSLGLDDGDALRVLFVFAEARGSRPLAARMERRELSKLFEREIYPRRRVVADVLTHGVTRQRLKSHIQEAGGYHIIHWSGHGHLNLLQLAKAGGGGDQISGDELLALCGGFIPRLVFLSACHSGEIMRVKNWQEFLAVAQGTAADAAGKGATEHASGVRAEDLADERVDVSKELPLNTQPGYTGTAHALLQGGVPSVVAMRYEVGDEYARELAVEFYRALLAHSQPKKVAAALTLARQALRDPSRLHPARFAHADHATPALYGAEDIELTVREGRSPALDPKSRRLHRIVELTTADHEDFVGRTWELAGLGADFIGSRGGTEVKPVAVITGLGGMGKTALTAEVLALWESRFDWVLLYQAKPNALAFEATLRDIHVRLNAELKRYHQHIQSSPADAIHRAATSDFTGAERLDRLTSNLIRALRDEPILLVLDNFETNLAPTAAGEDGETLEQHQRCQDPAWDRSLARLAEELVGSPSRVLITSRRPLTALAGDNAYRVLLGPLPAGEAALYLREHEALSRMMFGGDNSERALALRLLTASRFHPLLMNRLARLAATPSLRPQLMHALETLEKSGNYTQLPGLFATDRGDTKELAYLNDALATSLDQLLSEVGADARRLLWMIAIANEPVSPSLLAGVWSGDSHEVETMRRFKKLLESPKGLSSDVQDFLKRL